MNKVGVILLLASMLALLVAAPETAFADTVDASKIITWTFGAVPAAGAAGTYEWDLEAKAKDNHINQGLAQKSAAPNLWVLLAGLAKDAKTTGLAGGGGCPWAQADMDFEASKPQAVGPVWQIQGVMHTKVQANCVPMNPGNHLKQVAEATSKGAMSIAGATVTGVVVKEGAKLTVVPANKFAKGAVGFGAGTGTGKWFDPIGVELLEIETGTTVVEQLFSLDMEAVADGECTWDSTGIVLEAPSAGVSSCGISGGFASSWITTGPGLFSASLAGGVFSTTGALDGLPWVLTFEGPDVVRAALAPGDAPVLEADYAVPSSLVVDTNTYQQTLLLGSSAAVTVRCEAVGGIVELLVGGSDAPRSAAEGSGSSAPPYAAIAGIAAACGLALAAGGWYARRRLS